MTCYAQTCHANGTYDLIDVPPTMICRTPSCAYNWKQVDRQNYDYNFCSACGKAEKWANNGKLGAYGQEYWDKMQYMSEMHMTTAYVIFTADDFKRIHFRWPDMQNDEKCNEEADRPLQIEEAKRKAACKHEDNPSPVYQRAVPLTTPGDENKVRYTDNGLTVIRTREEYFARYAMEE